MQQPVPTRLLLDVVVPTYRLKLAYLERICSLPVPLAMRTTFIIIVDNPGLLLSTAATLSSDATAAHYSGGAAAAAAAQELAHAARVLEDH